MKFWMTLSQMLYTYIYNKAESNDHKEPLYEQIY